MYKVNLDIYSGPLALLYYLIIKNEIDIENVSISAIADQFVAFIKTDLEGKMDDISSFLLMAAKLMHIKSLHLLPQKNEDEIEALSQMEEEISRQMNEYILFKELSLHFESCLEDYQHTYERAKDESAFEKNLELRIEAIEPSVLRDIFIQLMEKAQKEKFKTHLIQRDIISIDDCMKNINEKLSHQETLWFKDLFSSLHHKQQAINFFLAILELSKENRIQLFQKEKKEDILIQKKTGVFYEYRSIESAN